MASALLPACHEPKASMCLEVFVVEKLEAAVGNENLRHADAFGRLVVLYDGSHDTGQSQGRTIERMAELYLLVIGMAVAAVQAIGLIALEV